jgi:hypothetical protein
VKPRARGLVVAFAIALGAGVMIVPRAARADDPPKEEELPRRQATFTWSKPPKDKKGPTLLQASFSFKDVVDKSIERKLASGIPTTIAMRAYVLREGDNAPIALAVRTCRVVYDLWDEVYRLKISGSGRTRDLAAVDLNGVMRNCAQVVDLPVADKAILTAGKPHFLGVIVEVNPISQEMLEQMRKWVSRPAGSTGISPGDALFGSFVGLFVRQIGSADRTLRFRTQSLMP